MIWTVKERDPLTGLFVPKVSRKNLFTSYGLTALASAIGGGYLAPQYLAINTANVTVNTLGNPGDTTIQLNGNPLIGSDTQMVLSVGTANQETVTVTSVPTFGPPYLFPLSAALVNSHPVNDPCVRAVTANDTIATFTSEAQYDPTYDPGNHAIVTAGYSGGTGNWVAQFYMTGLQAPNVFFATVGLVDQRAIGATNANLHDAVALGFNHNNTNDLEIDVSLTIVNY